VEVLLQETTDGVSTRNKPKRSSERLSPSPGLLITHLDERKLLLCSYRPHLPYERPDPALLVLEDPAGACVSAGGDRWPDSTAHKTERVLKHCITFVVHLAVTCSSTSSTSCNYRVAKMVVVFSGRGER
jgi:hypothetical protein